MERKCWFCEKNLADDELWYTIKLTHSEKTGFKQHTFYDHGIPVPRCGYCYSRHYFTVLGTRIFSIITYVILIVLIYQIGMLLNVEIVEKFFKGRHSWVIYAFIGPIAYAKLFIKYSENFIIHKIVKIKSRLDANHNYTDINQVIKELEKKHRRPVRLKDGSI